MMGERGSVSIVVAAIVAMALVLIAGAADLGRVLGAKAQARTAADAAALAAVQELALPTNLDPAAVAADYASRNGAVLVSCSCAAGTTDATVEVAVTVDAFILFPGQRTVTAAARAVVDLPSSPSPTPSAFPSMGTSPSPSAIE